MLPGTQEVKAMIAERMTGRLKTYIHEAQARLKQQVQPFIQKKRSLQHQHQNERIRLQEKQDKCWQEESRERSQRLAKGIKGIWFRITGRYHRIRKQNERETETCPIRDRGEMQSLIDQQLTQRQKLQDQIQPILMDYKHRLQDLRQEIARYVEIGGIRQIEFRKGSPETKKIAISITRLNCNAGLLISTPCLVDDNNLAISILCICHRHSHLLADNQNPTRIRRTGQSLVDADQEKK